MYHKLYKFVKKVVLYEGQKYTILSLKEGQRWLTQKLMKGGRGEFHRTLYQDVRKGGGDTEGMGA